MALDIRNRILEISRSSRNLPEKAWNLRYVLDQLSLLLGELDPALLAHGLNTAEYARSFASVINMSYEDLDHLYHAALLHDIGILALPAEMKHKTGPHTADDYAAIQSHPRDGAELLAMFPALQHAAVIVAHHHERWDGWGYPYGLRGTFIPLGSRILAIADTFDTLMWENSYQGPHCQEAALRLLDRLAGSQLDPDLVAGFVRLARDVNITERTVPALSM